MLSCINQYNNHYAILDIFSVREKNIITPRGLMGPQSFETTDLICKVGIIQGYGDSAMTNAVLFSQSL